MIRGATSPGPARNVAHVAATGGSGHGYVERYFDGYIEALPVKCYRCPACGCVITLRPENHFPRIRSPRQVIREHLHVRLSQGRWPLSPLARSRLRHWLANLKRQVLARLTHGWTQGLWPASRSCSCGGKSRWPGSASGKIMIVSLPPQ
jgi:hypothetical protein